MILSGGLTILPSLTPVTFRLVRSVETSTFRVVTVSRSVVVAVFIPHFTERVIEFRQTMAVI